MKARAASPEYTSPKIFPLPDSALEALNKHKAAMAAAASQRREQTTRINNPFLPKKVESPPGELMSAASAELRLEYRLRSSVITLVSPRLEYCLLQGPSTRQLPAR